MPDILVGGNQEVIALVFRGFRALPVSAPVLPTTVWNKGASGSPEVLLVPDILVGGNQEVIAGGGDVFVDSSRYCSRL